MFNRRLLPQLIEELHHSPAVALLGPRQAGKTTLALKAAKTLPGSICLDLESERDRTRLAQPELYLADHLDKLGAKANALANTCCWALPRWTR